MALVPVEPPSSPWAFPGPEGLDPTDDLVAVGADLAPGTLLAAYRRGLFPMPSGQGELLWFCPVRRAVLPVDGLRMTRSLRRSLGRFDVSVDRDFAAVLDGCADPRRDGGWIDEGIGSAYTALHELGWAHSVEVWREDRLVGGLYGVAIGGLFAGESMFHRETDASKVALAALVGLLDDDHADRRLLDAQWVTPHLSSLGFVGLPRSAYLARLRTALTLPSPFDDVSV